MSEKYLSPKIVGKVIESEKSRKVIECELRLR